MGSRLAEVRMHCKHPTTLKFESSWAHDGGARGSRTRKGASVFRKRAHAEELTLLELSMGMSNDYV